MSWADSPNFDWLIGRRDALLSRIHSIDDKPDDQALTDEEFEQLSSWRNRLELINKLIADALQEQEQRARAVLFYQQWREEEAARRRQYQIEQATRAAAAAQLREELRKAQQRRPRDHRRDLEPRPSEGDQPRLPNWTYEFPVVEIDRLPETPAHVFEPQAAHQAQSLISWGYTCLGSRQREGRSRRYEGFQRTD